MVTAQRQVSGAVDDVTYYLNNIARHDLLTAEDDGRRHDMGCPNVQTRRALYVFLVGHRVLF